MKKLWLILAALLAITGWLGRPVARDSGVPLVDPAPVIWQGSPPTVTMADPEEVFKKAFWRRPAPGDEILHAVRHEWSDEGGLLRWQWFLVVKASPGLLQYLRDDNAFGLVPSSSSSASSEAPVWFRHDPEKMVLLGSPGSAMQIFFSRHDSILHATASGHGFTRAVSETLPVTQGPPTPGRIPNTPPPRRK